jgi:hypothetical protein
MAAMPFIGDIAGLGKPALVKFAASRAAEYPMGLNKTVDVATTATGSKTVGPCSIPWDAAYNPAGSSWNFPNLYQLIQGTGSSPADDDVLVVPGNKFQWTQTTFEVDTTSKLSYDVRSDGLWTIGGGKLTAAGTDRLGPRNKLRLGGLIGKIGSGTPFFLGTHALCVPVRAKGTLYIAMNNGDGPAPADSQNPLNPPTGADYAKDKGAQIVRIVVSH